MKDLFDKRLLEKIGKKILKKKETVAVAESVTSGLLQFAFSNIPDAAKFLQGGITAFNLGQKFKHLTVEPIHAAAFNCVSAKVAEEMTLNVGNMFASDWSIGITGYASAVPEGNNEVLAYFAIAYKGIIKSKGRLKGVKTDPVMVQFHYAQSVLKKLSALV